MNRLEGASAITGFSMMSKIPVKSIHDESCLLHLLPTQQSAILYGGSFLFVQITAAEPVVKNIIKSSSGLWQWLCINCAHVQSFIRLMRHDLLAKAIDPFSSLMYLFFFPTAFINFTASNSDFSMVSICHLLFLWYYTHFRSRLWVFLCFAAIISCASLSLFWWSKFECQ